MKKTHPSLILLPVLLFSSVLCTQDLEGLVKNAILKAADTVEAVNESSTEQSANVPHLQKANAESIAAQRDGDILQEATRLLVEAHGMEIVEKIVNMNVDSILDEVQAVGNRRKRQADDNCIVKGPCDATSRFRTISGRCNHLTGNVEIGSPLTAQRRFMGAPKYDDGINSVRAASAAGGKLPSTREISNKIFAEASIPATDPKYSHMLMQYGQFIAHDVTFTPSSVGKNNGPLDCSACSSGVTNTNCAPIEALEPSRETKIDLKVPDGDSYFPARVNGTRGCIKLTRAINGQTGLGPRAQINQDTHFLDLSMVYGSTDCQAKSLRTFSKGGMKTFAVNGHTLPPQAKNDSNCQSAPGFLCFECGDIRNSLQPGLIPLHTIYLKQHNSFAAEIARLRPKWDDERIYQEVRRYMVAMWQYHVYSEYLPKVIGTSRMSQFGLNPSALKSNFDASVDPSVGIEFTANAFRFGHSQIRKDIPRTNIRNRTVGAIVNLGDNSFYSDHLYDRNAPEPNMAMGLINFPAMAVDRQFSFPVRNQIFEKRGMKASGVDLPAVNIQRARESGVHPYNDVRAKIGLRRVSSFDELKADMDASNVELLKKTYANVNDVDLYVGLLLERPTDKTALLGPTGSYLIADQFAAYKKGDRFFYESTDSPGALTEAEHRALLNFPFAKLDCSNTDGLSRVQKDIFVFNDAKVRCSSFKRFPMAAVLAK